MKFTEGRSNSAVELWVPQLEMAAREVFEIMLGSKLEPAAEVSPTPVELTAIVGLAGQVCGLLTLRCSSQAATLMASKMLGFEVKTADQQMWDAVGEIANMIAGNFKNKITGLADRCMLSVPTVISGSDYNCRSMTDTGPLEANFLFEKLPMSVGLEIHS